jgi:hypothetical protein
VPTFALLHHFTFLTDAIVYVIHVEMLFLVYQTDLPKDLPTHSIMLRRHLAKGHLYHPKKHGHMTYVY